MTWRTSTTLAFVALAFLTGIVIICATLIQVSTWDRECLLKYGPAASHDGPHSCIIKHHEPRNP